VWFGEITHPDYERIDEKGKVDGPRHLTWQLDVQVLRWN
jgi:hypothetical protein